MRTFFCFIFMLIPAFIFAISPPSGALEIDDDNNGITDRWETLNDKGGLSIYLDTKGDGLVDFVMDHDDDGYKIYEALDFNKDGELDDFYFYSREVLERREIDSNYDGFVDIWIYLSEGVYISSYERDTDFDGTVDVTKKYGEE